MYNIKLSDPMVPLGMSYHQKHGQFILPSGLWSLSDMIVYPVTPQKPGMHADASACVRQISDRCSSKVGSSKI